MNSRPKATIRLSPTIHAAKEGGTAGVTATSIGLLLESARATGITLPWDATHDPGAIGIATGLIMTIIRWLKNRRLKRKERRSADIKPKNSKK